MTIARMIDSRDQQVIHCTPRETVREAAARLSEHRIGAMPVCNGGEVVGIFSERDLLHCIAKQGGDALDLLVEGVMTAPPITADPDTTVRDALEVMTLRRIRHEHLTAITNALRKAGHQVHFNDVGDACTVHRGDNPMPANIITEPYPGYPTDMQAQMTALFATTPGTSTVVDTIFPQRFMHCAELKRMGADIQVSDGKAVIKGVKQLSAAPVMASDLRASAALVLAALTAKGSTEILRLYHIDRGYEHIDEKLAALGANVERVRD